MPRVGTPCPSGRWYDPEVLRSSGVAAIRPPVNPFLEELLVKKAFVVPTLRMETDLATLTLGFVGCSGQECNE